MDSTNLVHADPKGDDPQGQQRRTAGTERDHGEARRHRQRQKSDILDRDECLHRLSLLPGLLAGRLISPAIANSIRSTYVEILRGLERAKPANSAQLASDDIARVYREQPEMFKLLEPLMSDEQIDAILREATNDEPRQA